MPGPTHKRGIVYCIYTWLFPNQRFPGRCGTIGGRISLMAQIVECVPNFSEGRKDETLARLLETIESIAGVVVLDTHQDMDHNRSVITFAGLPDAVANAAFRVVETAAMLIDMRQHS